MKILPLHLLKKIAIPMYAHDLKHIKKHIISSEEGLSDFFKIIHRKTISSIVINAEWYEENKEYCKSLLESKLDDKWLSCEIYRDVLDYGIVTVVSLKSNKKPSSRINKRVVDRAFIGTLPTCVYTGKEIERIDASAEHIIPLSHGGNNSVWNICVATNSLNNDRGNQDFWQYWRNLLLEEIC